MDFVDEILNVKKPDGPLLLSLESSYRQIGEKFGYVIVQSPLFLMLKKQGSQVGFEVQFGNRIEFEESLKKLAQSGSDICIFITSSNVKTMRMEDARALLLKKFTIKSQKWIFFDLEAGRALKVNFEWGKFSQEVERPDWSRPSPATIPHPLFREKKKKIIGFRGEHKEND